MGKKWIDDKGFGFLTPDDGGEDVFVHRSSLDGVEALEEGDEVMYEVEYDNRKGKWKATSCTLKDGNGKRGGSGRSGGERNGGGGYSRDYDNGRRGGYDGGKGKGKGKSKDYDRYS